MKKDRREDFTLFLAQDDEELDSLKKKLFSGVLSKDISDTEYQSKYNKSTKSFSQHMLDTLKSLKYW